MIERTAQPGILALAAPYGRSMILHLRPEPEPRRALAALRDVFAPDWGVVGLGEPLLRSLGIGVTGLGSFPALAGPGCAVPASQGALWLMVRGEGRGTVFDRSEAALAALDSAFRLEDAIDTFVYAGGRDLTGYEDGTENPKGEEAVAAALLAAGKGLVGSSFVAVQRWVHDLRCFRSHTPAERDAIIGRHRESNEEIEDAPLSAHVKRTAQEDFDPPAFMLRRSMPFATGTLQGLEFIAYVAALDTFERQLRRMLGLEDGTVDALFAFSHPVTGGYYWCPPVAQGRLDLSHLRL